MSDITTFEEHLQQRYGKLGTPKRDDFERKSKAFAIGELIKEERKKANMTQTELAEKSGTKKSYISRIENGQSDIQLTTLFKIVETGLGKQLRLTID
ncbi:MAG TPA: helix-turn-helix transcriptional regulator [Cytophagales bacterium]|jgi:DNA-binding XRE family transcriptional regulator